MRDDAELRDAFVSEADDPALAAMIDQFAVAFDPGEPKVHLRPLHWLRSAPYLMHTNYELFLLLDGRKKFARMGNC